MKRVLALSFIFTVFLSTAIRSETPSSADAPTSPEAKAAIDDYAQTLRIAKDAYERTVSQAKEDYLRVLKAAREKAVARKDAEETRRIDLALAFDAKSYEVRDLKMKLIRLAPGEFLMGSPANEAFRAENEFQHRVKLTKPFFIQATEVSQAQYKAIAGANPSEFHGEALPVENVSWNDAVRFCEAMSKREGRKFRLPTEAEWEYAARAGKEGPVSGTGTLDEMAWHADNSGKAPLDSARLWDTDPNAYFQRLFENKCRTRDVGAGIANDWGIHDMQGNVTEWVADWYTKEYFKEEAAKVDPQGPEKSPVDSRVMRGGSWGSDPRQCRIAQRNWNDPAAKSGSRGFRVVMEAE